MTWSWPPFLLAISLDAFACRTAKRMRNVYTKLNEKREKAAACTTKKDKNSTVATKCDFYFAFAANLRILRLFAETSRSHCNWVGENPGSMGKSWNSSTEVAKVKLCDYLSLLKDAWGTFFCVGPILKRILNEGQILKEKLLNLFYLY